MNYIILYFYRLIVEHEKTQLEIDEEMVKSFDKLYPDNFRLLANPELLEGIIKKLDCVEENSEKILTSFIFFSLKLFFFFMRRKMDVRKFKMNLLSLDSVQETMMTSQCSQNK